MPKKYQDFEQKNSDNEQEDANDYSEDDEENLENLDGDQKDGYILDDFVVDDDSDKDSNLGYDGRQHKKKKRKEPKDIIPDDEDLELIAEYDEDIRHEKKLKRLKKVENVPEEKGSDDEFIVPEQHQRRTGESQQKTYVNNEMSQRIGLLHDVFVGNEQYVEGQEGEEFDQLSDDVPQEKKKKLIQDVFEPIEMENRLALPEDVEIRERDIPERLQIRYQGRKFPSNKELVDETKWIYEMMRVNQGSLIQAENFQKKILKILEYLRIQSFEPMYLHYYKKPELYPDIQLQDIWQIYELDNEWGIFYAQKETNLKDFEQLENFIKIPTTVVEMLKVCTEKEYLKYLSDYGRFHLSKYIDVNQKMAENQQFKLPQKRVFARDAIECRLDQFALAVGLTADQLAENILTENKLQQDNSVELHRPSYLNLTPEKAGDDYIQVQSSLCSDSLTTLTNLCRYMAMELFYHPVIRSWVRKHYYEYVTISTEPTLRGKKELNVNSYHYCVKRIVQRPIKEFRDETWLLMIHNEKEGLIRIKFQLPWEEDLKNLRKEFQDLKDEIYVRMLNLYISPIDQDMPEEKQHIVKQWNILRGEVLRMYLSENIYPSLEKSIREELTQKTEKFVTTLCANKFKEILMTSPYLAPLDDDHSAHRKARVVGVVYDTNTQSISFAAVDENGSLKDYIILKYYGIPMANEHQDRLIRQHFADDERNLQQFLEKEQPDLIVVSTNCVDARRIKQKLAQYSDKLKERNRDSIEKIAVPFVSYGDYLVPQLFSKTRKSNFEFKEFRPSLKEAISIARLRQNPLAEILNLWNDRVDDNALFYIPVHYLQHMISHQKLKHEYERVIVEAVNQIGLDLNDIVRFPHLQSQLQFICGLGPRKAKHIVECVQHQCGSLKFRMEVWAMKILEKTVYINCIGFLKISQNRSGDQSPYYQGSSSDYDILDTTRIHPENYILAKKIAKDALADEKDDGKDDWAYRIMHQPEELIDLGLEEYADHLAKVKSKPNMIYLLQFIVDELSAPFKDPRAKNQEMSNEDLFYKLCKENPLIFTKNTVVNAKVVKVLKQNLICKILDNDLIGSIYATDVFDKFKEVGYVDLTKKFSEGDSFKARVKNIDFEKFKVDLTIKESYMKTTEPMLEQLIPNWNSIKNSFKIKEDEDFPSYQEVQKVQVRYIPRKINHPKFKNMSIVAAIEYLSDKPIGDYIFRPSSKSTEFLNLTWKFHVNVILHLLIREEGKAPNSLIGRKLWMGRDSFDTLDEIIDKYIVPCNQLMKAAANHKKFIHGELDYIEEELYEDKRNDSKHIPYYFGCIENAPQYLVLCYIPRSTDIIKEYIKVKHNGLFFHGYLFTSVNMLISWFKENFKTQEYQRYLRKVKPPFVDQKDQVNVKYERPGDQSPNRMVGGYQSPTYDPVKEEYTRVKDESIKKEKRYITCNTCGQVGHMANECTENYRQANMNYNNSNQYQHRDYSHHNNRSYSRRSRSRSNSRERGRQTRDNYHNRQKTSNNFRDQRRIEGGGSSYNNKSQTRHQGRNWNDQNRRDNEQGESDNINSLLNKWGDKGREMTPPQMQVKEESQMMVEKKEEVDQQAQNNW